MTQLNTVTIMTKTDFTIDMKVVFQTVNEVKKGGFRLEFNQWI